MRLRTAGDLSGQALTSHYVDEVGRMNIMLRIDERADAAPGR
jgi:hypothetical protein